MNNKLLIGMLIASWTVIVMLGTALYLRTIQPIGGYWMDKQVEPDRPQAPMFLKEQWGQKLREDARPMHERAHRIMVRLHETFLLDSLNITEWNQLVDSLIQFRSDMHRHFLYGIAEIHPNLTSDEREKVLGRIMHRMEGGPPRNGRHPGMKRLRPDDEPPFEPPSPR